MNTDIIKIGAIEIHIDADRRFCLNDLHRAAIELCLATKIQEPSQWIKRKDTQRYVDFLKKLPANSPVGMGLQPIESNKGGEFPETLKTSGMKATPQ